MTFDLAPKQALSTPWGDADNVTDMGNGILSVSTPSHGGLMIPKDMAKHIPQAVRSSFMNKDKKAVWAEEDCEMTIAAFLFDRLPVRPPRPLEAGDGTGEGDFSEKQTHREFWTARAREIAERFPNYKAALKHLQRRVESPIEFQRLGHATDAPQSSTSWTPERATGAPTPPTGRRSQADAVRKAIAEFNDFADIPITKDELTIVSSDEWCDQPRRCETCYYDR